MTERALSFSRIPGRFAVCRLPANAPLPEWAWSTPFASVTRTTDELSIVCAADGVPQQHRPTTPWVCLKIEGPFSFSEVGVLSSFIDPLAKKGVPIFAISTFDTDYVLVGEGSVETALQALTDAGHKLLA
jgi:uncharacterized protein